jgi:sugar lactone lactonase YvrE
MRSKTAKLPVAAAAAGLGLAAVLAAGPASAAGPVPDAAGAHTPAASSRIVAHFDPAKGQTPENIALGPDGTAYVTFSAARQVAAVSPGGAVRILVTMPAPADGGVNTPVSKAANTGGIVRTGDGTLYFLYDTGNADSTGLYRLRPGGTPHRIAALPPTGLPNGLALDEHTSTFYAADSVLGVVWTVPLSGGRARVWLSAPEFAPAGFLGANGIKVHDGAVWVSNLDKATLLRIPLRHDRPGPVQVRVTGLASIDDFTFTRAGDVLAALDGPSAVVRIGRDGRVTTFVDAADGVQNPTSVAVRGGTVYVLSAAFFGTDPNLVLATLPRH